MESTAPDLHEIIEETQNSQTLSEEEQEINYSSWDMVESTWGEHHSKYKRELLQFCYLFPQDYEFKKNDMVQLWIALKILLIPLDETASYAEMMYAGNLCFEEYEEMNIFILSSLDHSTHLQRYKLNKSVFHLLQQQHDHDVYSKVEDISSYVSENTRHACMHDCSMNAVTLEKLYQAKRLRTLLIFHESGPKVGQVPREVFLKLPWISALDLSGTNIKEVPSSIGKLKQLRYLNLSGTSIVRLPESVCSLQEMRILKLRGCLKLVSLPNGMRRLVKLQYLDVDVARLLVSMPPGLGDLIDLHNLPAFVVGREDGCSITELKQMENLHGTLRILRLENVSSWEEAADAALDCKRHIVKLQLQWTEFHDGIQYEVLQNLQPYTQIQELQIVGFAGSKFPSWIGDPLFYQLVKITLHDCRKCKRLPPSGKLPFLKHFFVSDMQAVKAIDGLFCGREMVGGLLDFKRLVIKTMAQFTHNSKFLAFPSLEMLTLNGMPALEKWIGIEIGDFHNLQKLIITCCFKLTSLPELSLLLSLQELEISLCTSLKSLPNKGLPISLQSLIIMDCPLLKEWCLKEAKLIRGRLADIPNIWIDYMQISLNTEVSDSGRNLRARQHVYEPRTRENKQMEEQLVNHGKNKKVLGMKEIIFGKNSKELQGLDSQTGTFTLRQIKAATNNFDPANKIGEGGFGPIFKGLLLDGTIIAVKQLSSKSKQGNREFVNEIGMLSALQHRNLVRLYGCCIEGNQLLLVNEYLENNSLARALFSHDESQLTLDWPTRRRICVDIARALVYLHDHTRVKIVHRNIKATNVLLDKDLNAKVSDFGLGKLDDDENYTHISTRIAGSFGYMAPEYAMRGYLTDKADVYSFGVVALEIVSGRSNNTNRPTEESMYLLDWALVLQENGDLLDLVDPRLESNYVESEALTMINIALLCTNASPRLRPNMNSVMLMLEGEIPLSRQHLFGE